MILLFLLLFTTHASIIQQPVLHHHVDLCFTNVFGFEFYDISQHDDMLSVAQHLHQCIIQQPIYANTRQTTNTTNHRTRSQCHHKIHQTPRRKSNQVSGWYYGVFTSNQHVFGSIDQRIRSIHKEYTIDWKCHQQNKHEKHRCQNRYCPTRRNDALMGHDRQIHWTKSKSFTTRCITQSNLHIHQWYRNILPKRFKNTWRTQTKTKRILQTWTKHQNTPHGIHRFHHMGININNTTYKNDTKSMDISTSLSLYKLPQVATPWSHNTVYHQLTSTPPTVSYTLYIMHGTCMPDCVHLPTPLDSKHDRYHHVHLYHCVSKKMKHKMYLR